MSNAVGYLKSLGIESDKDGNILSKLPSGEKGMELIDKLEELAQGEDYTYTIIGKKLTKIDI